MKKEQLVDALGHIDDKYLKEAHENQGFSFNLGLSGKLLTAAFCLLLLVNIIPHLFAGKSSSQDATEDIACEDNYAFSATDLKNDFQDNYAFATDEADIEAARKETANTTNDNKKLIITGHLEMETLSFDQALESLQNNIADFNGYIQNSSLASNPNSTRSYQAVIRIPADNYDSFLSQTKGSANVIYYNENKDDITQTYSDLFARITSLKAQEEAILALYKQAASLSEMIEVENRLSEIRYEIDSLETRMRNYNLLIAYSTLNITIRETRVYTQTNDNFFSRLTLSFTNGFHNFLNNIEELILDLTYNLWLLLIIVIFVLVGIRVYRKYKNK